MFKFSRQFFGLFMLVTVLPMGLVIIWHVYSAHLISKQHEDHMIRMHNKHFMTQLEDTLKATTETNLRIVEALKRYNPSMEEYQKALKVDHISRIRPDGSLETMIPGVKQVSPFENIVATSYYDFYKTKSKTSKDLYKISVIPMEKQDVKGFFTTTKVDLEKDFSIHGPVVLKLYQGNQATPENQVFFTYELPEPSGLSSDVKFPPPPSATTPLTSNTSPLKTPDNKTIALVEIGVPEEKNWTLFSHNPRLELLFSKMYAIAITIPLLGLVLSLIAGYYLKRNFVTPMVLLSKASQEIKKGNYSVRLETDQFKQAEVVSTIENINLMIENLEEKETLRENFIANLTHDLKTPLIAEERTLELLLEEINPDETPDKQELLKSLLNNNKHLLAMVNQVLETYKLDGGKIALKQTSINLPLLLESCIQQVKPLLSEKNITISLESEETIPSIYGDESILKRVFINLLDNSIENIPKGSAIEVIMTVYQEQVLVKIRDNGPGIPPEDLKKLFDRYYTVKTPQRKIGTGLGLYICRVFIEAHHGTIDVTSELGSFSEFSITLPTDRKELDLAKTL